VLITGDKEHSAEAAFDRYLPKPISQLAQHSVLENSPTRKKSILKPARSRCIP